MLKTFELHSWRAALKGLAALALWPAVTGCLPSLGYLVGQNWLLPAWILGGGVAAWAAWRLGRRRALLLCVLYALGSFFLTSITFLGQSGDYFSYHLPQVFLLEAGWNPALQGSIEAVDALGIAPLDTFRPFHTVCFPLLGAQWSAATDLATGALFGFNWLVALLFPGAGYLTLRTLHRCLPTLRPWQAWALTLLFVLLDYRITATWFPIDGILYLLLLAWCLTLIAHLSNRAAALEQGLVFALPLLLAGVKQSAAVPIALGFGLLLVHALVRRDWQRLRERALLCLLTLCAIALFWFHPYLTNWAHYGSPLFPAHSFLPAFQGWDITVDLLYAAKKTMKSPFTLFFTTNWIWIALTAVLGLIAYWQRALRPLFAVAVLLLLNALLMPWWLYTYTRYTSATPIIGGLLLCVIPDLSHRLPMRRLLQATLLFAVLLTFLVDYQARDIHYAPLPQALLTAANLQTLLYFPERRIAPEDQPVIASNKAIYRPKDSPILAYPKRYTPRNDSYVLHEIYITRGRVPVRVDYTVDNLTRLRYYILPANINFLVTKHSNQHNDLYVWQNTFSFSVFRHLVRAIPRNFYRRWIGKKREDR